MSGRGTKEKEMGMRRDMRVAAAASILFLAAGTGAAHATSPFGESFAEGMRWIRLIGNVTVQVTEFELVDSGAGEARIKWNLSNEDASLADRRNGYCMRVSVADGAWQEKCVSGTPASATTNPPRVRTYYWGDMTIEFPASGGYWTRVQVKMEYGTGGYTSWSSEFTSHLRY